MDRETLISYISKLNDRNLQQQQASGFTLWAILGLIAYLILGLSDKIPLIYNSTELKFYLVIFSAGVIDFLILICLLIFSIIEYSTPFGKRKFFSTVDSKSSFMSIFPFCFIVFVFSIINFIAANLVETIKMSPWIFWSFFLILALTGINPFIQKAKRFIKSSKKTYLNISEDTPGMRLTNSITYAYLSIIGLLFLYFTYRDISIPLEAVQITLLLKTSIEIFAFLILVYFLFYDLNSKNKFVWLKKLEMEIYIDDLSDNEIRERLEKEYIGYNVLKWISRRNEVLNTVSNEYLNLLKEEKPKMDEIMKEIDNEYTLEKVGRLEIFDKIQKKFQNILFLANETSDQYYEIIKQNQIPDKDEIKAIIEANIEWGKQIKHLETENNDFFK